MVKQTRAKQERIIEAVRHGLEGDAAVDFVHQSGYALNGQGIARNLRKMGGRGRIQDMINEGLSNVSILQACFPDDAPADLPEEIPSQGDLFAEEAPSSPVPVATFPGGQFETTKLTVKLPTDLYEALRFASRAEGKSQTQLVVEILTSALSRMPCLSED